MQSTAYEQGFFGCFGATLCVRYGSSGALGSPIKERQNRARSGISGRQHRSSRLKFRRIYGGIFVS